MSKRLSKINEFILQYALYSDREWNKLSLPRFLLILIQLIYMFENVKYWAKVAKSIVSHLKQTACISNYLVSLLRSSTITKTHTTLQVSTTVANQQLYGGKGYWQDNYCVISTADDAKISNPNWKLRNDKKDEFCFKPFHPHTFTRSDSYHVTDTYFNWLYKPTKWVRERGKELKMNANHVEFVTPKHIQINRIGILLIVPKCQH